MKTVAIAMSGGVDSSVAAKLLQLKGYDCLGVTMQLFSDDKNSAFSCSNSNDISDAIKVCEKIQIPHEVFNLSDSFNADVIQRFIQDYESGLTPNPCIYCNKSLKFGLLLSEAQKKGYDNIATGHYARIFYNETTGRYNIKKAADSTKDQSYVLYSLSQEVLSHVLFPLGELTKAEIRKIASDSGFSNSNKAESQDICFIPDGDYASFIETNSNKAFPPGNILDETGNVVGTHRGAIRYTLGQRRGLGMGFGRPVFVYEKNMENNTVSVGPENLLYKSEVFVKDVNFISIEHCVEPLDIKARLRYSQREAPATMYPWENGVRLVFSEPQRAPAPGQAAVFYQDDLVVGGGTIV